MNNEKRYEIALGLMGQQTQLFWLSFGAYLLIETVLLNIIASASSKYTPNIVVFCSSILGFLLTIPWLFSYIYNSAIWDFRIEQAKMCEPWTWAFLREGERFIKGDKILGKKMPMHWFIDRFGRPRRAYYAIIGFFALAFLGLACISPYAQSFLHFLASIKTHAAPMHTFPW